MAQSDTLHETLGKNTTALDPPKNMAKLSKERNKILSWISNIPYESHHKAIAAKRLQGTCGWLLTRQEYQDWINSAVSETFWLHGIRKFPVLRLLYLLICAAGSGKT